MEDENAAFVFGISHHRKGNTRRADVGNATDEAVHGLAACLLWEVSHGQDGSAQPIRKLGERFKHGPHGGVLVRVNAASARAEIGINRIDGDESDIAYSGDKVLEHIKVLWQVEDAASAAVDLGDGGDDGDLFAISLCRHQTRHDGVGRSVLGTQNDDALFCWLTLSTGPLTASAHGGTDECGKLRFAKAGVAADQRCLADRNPPRP
jgi:hypothetical protein